MAYTTIDKPTDYFNTVLYTGDSTDNRTVTGVGFQPDFLWIKDRTSAFSHALFDSVRGSSKMLVTQGTEAEQTNAGSGGLTSFDTDGFTTDAGVGANPYRNTNQSGDNYVSWNWLASNTTASNTDGDITSSVSVNTTAGFSIGTYTGSGTDGNTVGTGLTGLSLVIAKCRNTTGGWVVKHQSLSGDNNVYLQITNAAGSAASSGAGGIGALNNSTFPLVTGTSGAGSSQVNKSGNTHVFYAFAEKKGYSKFGSYVGNLNADGPFIYTGFKPAWLLIKETTQTRNWVLYDNKRVGYNPNQYEFLPDTSNTEDTTTTKVDLLSNGFKIKASHATVNENAQTYIFMAFAENPFTTSTGVPATAR